MDGNVGGFESWTCSDFSSFVYVGIEVVAVVGPLDDV